MSQEFHSKVKQKLDLVKHKGSYPYKYLSGLKSFIVCFQGKNSDKECEHVLKVWDRFEMKTMINYHELYLKYDVLFLADAIEKFGNSSLKKLLVMPESIFERSSFNLGCNA